MFILKNVCLQIEEKEILKELNLEILKGEIHAIMGPNGAGKSTIAKLVAGDPSYELTEGDIRLDQISLVNLEPNERALKGVFVGFQHPPEIPGLPLKDFLYHCVNASREANQEKPMSEEAFEKKLYLKMDQIKLPLSFAFRGLNEGFSGGEKRKVEMLQLSLLNPKFAILDEIDSGLDVDAMRLVGEAVLDWHTPDKGILLITHYTRLLQVIQPDRVHILVNGSIVKSGDAALAFEIEERGYEHFCEACS